MNKQQFGNGLKGILIIVALAFFGWFSYLTVPIYYENITIKNAIRALDDMQSLKEKSSRYWTSELQKQFEINNIRRLSARDVDFVNDGGDVVAKFAYQVQVNFLLNLDFIVNFDDEIEVFS